MPAGINPFVVVVVVVIIIIIIIITTVIISRGQVYISIGLIFLVMLQQMLF